jgi:CHAD domain-containing protein
MEEVDPDAGWKRMQKIVRKLFRSLGALRDLQVMKEWVKALGNKNDGIRTKMELEFGKEEKALSEAVLKEAAKFDTKEWKKLERGLQRRTKLIAAGSPAAECIVLERYEEAKERHARALRGEKPKAWHKLRIGLKHFRYATENLLPEHSAAWGKNLKRVQDLLGEIHDLDVLAERVEKAADEEHAESRKSWETVLQKERHERVQTYRRLTLGKTSLWRGWRNGLPHGKKLEEATLALLRATSRAMGTRSRNATKDARIARRLFDSVSRSKTCAVFAEPDMRKLFLAASRLYGQAATEDGESSRKAARKFLKKMTPPPGWVGDEWEIVLATNRYERGAEPRAKDNIFAKLSTTQQEKVRGLAGVLRLARALRKCGMETCVGLKVTKSPEALIVNAPNLGDSEDAAIQLAAGKHLLERQLDRPLIVKGVPKKDNLVTLPTRKEQPEMAAAATASD